MQGHQDRYKRSFRILSLPPAFNMKIIYYAKKEHHICQQKALPTLNYPSLPRRQSQCTSWDPLAGTCFHCCKKVSNFIEENCCHLFCIPIHHRHILFQGALVRVHVVWMVSIRSCKTTLFMFYWWVKNGNHTRAGTARIIYLHKGKTGFNLFCHIINRRAQPNTNLLFAAIVHNESISLWHIHHQSNNELEKIS